MSEPSGEQGIGGVRWVSITLWGSGVVAVALALGFSIGSLIEFSGHSSLCNLAACKTVSQSLFARSIPVPLPVVGVLTFGLQMGVAMALFRKPTQLRHRVWQVGCWLGGTVAIGLIAVQLVWLRQICPLCMGIDVAAVLSAPLALHQLDPTRPETLLLIRWLAVVGFVAAVSPDVETSFAANCSPRSARL